MEKPKESLLVLLLPIRRNGGQPSYGDACCGESPTLNISVCLAGFAGVLGERRFCEPLEGLRASDTSALCWVCAGMLGERGLG
jgi:hypothetical protein